MTNIKFDGSNFRIIGTDHFQSDEYRSFSTGLLRNFHNQSQYLDQHRGASCSIQFAGKGRDADDFTNMRPLAAASRWVGFFVLPYQINPGLAEIIFNVFYRTSIGRKDAAPGDISSVDTQVQLRPYLIGRSKGITPGEPFISIENVSNEQIFSSHQMVLQVDSSDVLIPTRDLLVIDVFSDAEIAPEVSGLLTGGSIDALNGEFVDLSAFVPLMFRIDTAANSPEENSQWHTCFEVRDNLDTWKTFHEAVYSETNDKQGAVYPFINAPNNNVVVEKKHLPYIQIRNIDISERYDRSISTVATSYLQSLRNANGQGVGGIAANSTELSRRYDLVCGRIETMYSDRPNSDKKDNFYGLRNYWTSPYIRSTGARTFVGGGRTNFASPRLLVRTNIIGTHSRTAGIKNSDNQQDGDLDPQEALNRYTIDGLIDWTIEIYQDGVLIETQTVENELIKYWPASNDDVSPFLLQTYHAEREIVHRTGNTYRSGLLHVDKGNGPDAFLIAEIAQEFIVDNPNFDRRCDFEIRLTMQQVEENNFPRWADESAFPQNQQNLISGPHPIGTLVASSPPQIPYNYGFLEFPETNPAPLKIASGNLITDGVRVGDDVIIRGAPRNVINGRNRVVEVVGAQDLTFSPEPYRDEDTISWGFEPVAGEIEIQRSKLDVQDLRIDIVGFGVWATEEL